MNKSINNVSPLPRTAKGPQLDILSCTDAERVLSIAMASAAEISALYDRISTLEHLIIEMTGASGDTLHEMFNREDVREERKCWRSDFVSRLLRGLESELEDSERSMSRKDYEKFIEKLKE